MVEKKLDTSILEKNLCGLVLKRVISYYVKSIFERLSSTTMFLPQTFQYLKIHFQRIHFFFYDDDDEYHVCIIRMYLSLIVSRNRGQVLPLSTFFWLIYWIKISREFWLFFKKIYFYARWWKWAPRISINIFIKLPNTLKFYLKK